MKELEPLKMLKGQWHGEGQGPQGPFEVEATFEERGRWLLLRHAIMPPNSSEAFYVSSQVYGYDDAGLTLDYFDTAGSFKFRGNRDGEKLSFEWKSDSDQEDGESDHWKKSQYWREKDNAIGFKYESMEPDSDKKGASTLLVFEGVLKPKKND